MIKSQKTFILIYFFAFFWALSGALVSYIQSSYLEQFVNTQSVGWYVAVATIVTLISLWLLPRYIRTYSNYRVSFVFIVLLAVSYFLLAHVANLCFVLLFFTVNFAAATLLGLNIDVFLEDISENEKTGRIRTRFMTIINIAWVLAPMLMGKLVGFDSYANVYFWSGIIILPAMLLLFWEQRVLGDKVEYKNRQFGRLGKIFSGNRNLRNIFITQFVLRLFYCWMVFYTPLYLHNNLGLDWTQIGAIFTVMLLPFIIFEIPAGFLADRYWGEKEIMIIGFLIMGGATAAIFFITSLSVAVWAAVLFLTRVGASLVEAMQESYFFKIVDKQDIDLISLFRNLYPLSWLIGSLLAVVLLLFLPLSYLFLVLAAIVLYAVYPSATLEDTR